MKTFLLFLVTSTCISQSIMVGNKSFEIGYTYKTEGLNYGISVSTVDSDLVEKRANNNDISKHDFNSSYTPAVFGLIGATFDKVTITGKLGGSYVEQEINSQKDSQNLFFAAGVNLGYQINKMQLQLSYDNVNSVMLGIGLNLL